MTFLSCAEGNGWGQGCVYPMRGEDEFGSMNLEKHLPVTPFQQCKVTRIVYPLLVHSLENKTGMNRQKMPTAASVP